MYRAEPITQRDGSSLQNSNCLMAAAAVGLDFHTLGDQTSTGKAMRSYCGDQSGGTNSDEIERAWKTGYDQDPYTRDGRPWSDVLEDLRGGRLVMLQGWAATWGGPCLSGSGAYGHGIAVAPEYQDGKWLVADPWCKPPKWVWWSESKLKAGAEEWYSRCVREAGGHTAWDALEWFARRLIVKALMDKYRPDRPALDDPPPSAGGGGGVLFASTRPHPEASDMAINTNGSRIASVRYVDLTAEAGFYADAELTEKLGTLAAGRACELIGPALGTNSHAILVNTSKPYSDGEDRPTIVYVTKDKCSDGYQVLPPDPECPPDPACEAAVAARDAEWIEWVRAMPDSMAVQVADLPSLVEWAQAAPARPEA